MRLKVAFVCATVFCALVASTADAASMTNCGSFTRNLKVGMSGADVRALQQVLNSDPRTRIADTGPGSAGNESTYYGTKTKLAVIKFQELYNDDVLAPAGLLHGNGFIGTLTRKKLSALCSSATTPNHPSSARATPPLPTMSNPQSTPTPTPSAPQASNDSYTPTPMTGLASAAASQSVRPVLKEPASYAVHQGGRLIIYGAGFTPTNNTVSVGSTNYTGLSPRDSSSIEVDIPNNAAKGKFDLKFSNAKGVSNKTFIVITDPSAVAPSITSFTPKTGLIGTTVTITGENLSKDWNDVVVGANIITGVVSPDGKTLTFTATIPVPGVSAGEDVPNVNVSTPLWFYVVNPNGVSGPSVFTLKF